MKHRPPPAALSFYGAQRATRQQLTEALAARLDVEAAEHRRWPRDQVAGVYPNPTSRGGRSTKPDDFLMLLTASIADI